MYFEYNTIYYYLIGDDYMKVLRVIWYIVVWVFKAPTLGTYLVIKWLSHIDSHKTYRCTRLQRVLLLIALILYCGLETERDVIVITGIVIALILSYLFCFIVCGIPINKEDFMYMVFGDSDKFNNAQDKEMSQILKYEEECIKHEEVKETIEENISESEDKRMKDDMLEAFNNKEKEKKDIVVTEDLDVSSIMDLFQPSNLVEDSDIIPECSVEDLTTENIEPLTDNIMSEAIAIDDDEEGQFVRDELTSQETDEQEDEQEELTSSEILTTGDMFNKFEATSKDNDSIVAKMEKIQDESNNSGIGSLTGDIDIV